MLGRAIGLYRRTASSRTAMVLLLANLIPLVGVVFFGWSLLTILVLYWVENGIVGFWNIPKIILAQGSVMPTLPIPDADATAHAPNMGATPAPARGAADRWTVAGPPGHWVGAMGRVGIAIFFAFHYGIFWIGHGFFVLLALPEFGSMGTPISDPCFDARSGPFTPPLEPGFPAFPGAGIDCPASPFGEVLWGSVGLAAVALFISHGASFLFNYIGRGEYRTSSPTSQMGSPYGRVVVLHLTIIFGAMLVAFLGSPLGALLVLIVLKTLFDLALHLREHRAAAARSSAALPDAAAAPPPATA